MSLYALKPSRSKIAASFGPAIRRIRRLIHVGKQLAAVPEAGESVRRRVLMTAPACSEQVMERDGERHQQEDRRAEGRDRGDHARARRICAVAEFRPIELGVQPELDSAGALARAELQGRLCRRAPRHPGQKDDRRMRSTAHSWRGSASARRCGPEPRASSERRDRSPSPLRAASAVCAGRGALGSDGRTERNCKQLTLLDPELPDHDLSSARGIRTSLEREHAADCEQPEQPDANDEDGRPARAVRTHFIASSCSVDRSRHMPGGRWAARLSVYRSCSEPHRCPDACHRGIHP